MAALDDLKTLLLGKADLISFDIDKAMYLAAVDNWFPLAQARQALSGNSEVQSYSSGGRTFSRNQLNIVIHAEQAALNDVLKFLKLSGDGLLDARWFEGNRVGIYTS
jgi:hypothetical protein